MSTQSENSDMLVLDSEEELQFSLIKRITRSFLCRSFVSADEQIRQLERRLERFTYVFVFVRLKGHKYGENGPDSENIRLNRATDAMFRKMSDGHYVINGQAAHVRFAVLELAEDILVHPYERQFDILEVFLEYCRSAVSRELDLPVQVLCSDILSGLKRDCVEQYRSALFSVDHVFDLYPDCDVVSIHTTMEHIPDTSELCPKPEWEHNYLDALSNYQLKKNEQMLHLLIDQEINNPNTALSIRNRVQNRLFWTLTVLGLPVNRSLKNSDEIYHLARNVVSCKTCGEVHEYVSRFFSLLSRYYQSAPMDINQKIEMICDCIQREYMDQSLSAGSIGTRFSISQAYLSRTFRQKKGVKLIDYLHMTRLHHAKQLLSSTDLRLDEISVQVGYVGEWSLIRAFKHYEGTTPGSFRSTGRLQGSRGSFTATTGDHTPE